MTTLTWTLETGGNFASTFGWTPAGQAPVAGDTADITLVFIGGQYNVDVTDNEAAALINIDAANAELVVESGGVLSAGSINLTSGTLSVVSGAEITGSATISAAPLAITNFIDGTLDGVTWKGTLGLTGVTQSSLLTITSGLQVLNAAGNGPGEIDITGPGAALNIASTITLDGTAATLPIDIGASGGNTDFLSVGSGDVLTLGSLAALHQTAAGSAVALTDIDTGGTIVNAGTMQFTAGAGASAQIGLSDFTNDGTINEQGGAANGESLDISPVGAFRQGASGLIALSDFGRVGITASTAPGSMDIDGAITATGTSTLALNINATGGGTVSLSDNSTVDMFNFSGTVEFLDSTDTVKLEQPGSYTGFIAGLGAAGGTADVIDLLSQTVTSLAPYSGTAIGGVLTVKDGASTVATINLVGDYRTAPFTFGDDGHAGTEIFLACYLAGTRVLTDAGEVPVEQLRVGDQVVTLLGGRLAPIVWLGHRHVICAGRPRARDVWPIRIKAGAIADGMPHCDLWLSPEHAVLLGTGAERVLVPVRHLLNGTTIAQVSVPSATYWHVELGSHDSIVAEGLPAESYLDTGNRAAFANGGSAVALHPDFGLLRREVDHRLTPICWCTLPPYIAPAAKLHQPTIFSRRLGEALTAP